MYIYHRNLVWRRDKQGQMGYYGNTLPQGTLYCWDKVKCGSWTIQRYAMTTEPYTATPEPDYGLFKP